MFKKDSATQRAVEFAKLISGIGEIYSWEFSPQVIEIYWRILEPFSFEDVKAAIYRHIQDPDVGRFLPKPADIIMAIEGSSQNRALAAWSKVIWGLQRVGTHTRVTFDDALIHLVVMDMGGWIRLGNSEERQMPFIAKEFQERYREYVRRKPSKHPKYLYGRYASSKPVLIGDALKAQEVIATGEDNPHISITDEYSVSTTNSTKLESDRPVPNLIPLLDLEEENYDSNI